MKKTERHHVIPISLHGHDNQENVIFVTPEEHKIIHQTLNVHYNSIRLFRKRTNEILFINEYWVREMATLHMIYFRNAHNLSSYLKIEQAKSLLKQTEKLIKQYSIQDFKIKDAFENDNHQLQYMVRAYHSAYLIAVLKNNQT